MSDKHLARRAETQVVLNGVDISVYVNKDWIFFTYTDNEEDEADDLQIKVCDRDGKWLRKWLNSIIDGGPRRRAAQRHQRLQVRAPRPAGVPINRDTE